MQCSRGQPFGRRSRRREPSEPQRRIHSDEPVQILTARKFAIIPPLLARLSLLSLACSKKRFKCALRAAFESAKVAQRNPFPTPSTEFSSFIAQRIESTARKRGNSACQIASLDKFMFRRAKEKSSSETLEWSLLPDIPAHMLASCWSPERSKSTVKAEDLKKDSSCESECAC